jgi:hypothetical protein
MEYERSYKTNIEEMPHASWLSDWFALIRFRDMIEKYGLEFYRLAKVLELVKRAIEQPNLPLDDSDLGPNPMRKEMFDFFGLTQSAKLWARLLRKLTEKKEPLTQADFKELDGRIRDELEDVWFMHLSDQKADLYNGKDLFGSQVSQQFPSAILEVEEAAKCLALGRATATVFHCMRILELGLNSLAREFGVRFEHRNWENVINDIEAAIKKISSDPNRAADWKNLVHFCSEAAVQFRFFKDAWRNYSMHVHERYNEEYATLVFNSVKEFMKQLATRLSEAPFGSTGKD